MYYPALRPVPLKELFESDIYVSHNELKKVLK